MKNKVSKKTKKALLKILAYLKPEPARLDMLQWGTVYPSHQTKQSEFGSSPNQPIPPCKTTACLAGTALLVSPTGTKYLKENNCVKPVADAQGYEIEFPWDTSEVATKLLGISEEQADRLFYFKPWGHHNENGDIVGWPEKFSTRYNKAKTAIGRFNALEARIKHFIKTGE